MNRIFAYTMLTVFLASPNDSNANTPVGPCTIDRSWSTAAPIQWFNSSSHSYLCRVAEKMNLNCSQVLNAYVPFEASFHLTKLAPPLPRSPYRIEPLTHRVWLTDDNNPKEIDSERLSFYQASLKLHNNSITENHFWCRNPTKIPKTIQAIKNFGVPVIIHSMGDFEDSFITKNIIKAYMKDGLYAFAGQLIRAEIILMFGGLYMDIGLEQQHDVTDYFKKYDFLHAIWHDQTLDIQALAAKRNLPFLQASLELIRDLPNIISGIQEKPTPHDLLGFSRYSARLLTLAQEQDISLQIGFLFAGEDFFYHGYGSWHNQTHMVTPSYFLKAAEKPEYCHIPFSEKPVVSRDLFGCILSKKRKLDCKRIQAAHKPLEVAFQ